MNYLYHGSTTHNIKTLEPRNRYVPAGGITFDAVYATDVPAFAAAQAFPWSSDEGIDVDIFDGKIKMFVPIQFKERLSVPISIYKVSDQDFGQTAEELTGLTWHSKKPVEVLEETTYPSVKDAIVALGGEIIYT